MGGRRRRIEGEEESIGEKRNNLIDEDIKRRQRDYRDRYIEKDSDRDRE